MYLLVIYLPLISFITAICFGRFIGKNGASYITTSCITLTFFISCFIFYEVGLHQAPCHIKLFPWILLGPLKVDWGFYFDSLTSSILIIITSISSLVHLYSISYMSEDPHRTRFMSYLSLFTFFMIMLVTADNFLQLFLGWEGVGLTSYLLINFWFTRLQANKSGMKAMIVNRIGDFGLTIALLAIGVNFKSFDYNIVFTQAILYENEYIHFFKMNFDKLTFITFFLFIGAIGKSAQIFLHTWLPDAMEGPTPVSALIHAATMVTAGVFLLLRCSPLLEHTPFTLTFITFIGALTAFFAATIGVFQNDLKRVIAYSTCSQLGYMVFACGLSNYAVSFFHLMNHAFFKALLFLSAGAIIHALNDEQDMRKMGGLIKILPFTYTMMCIGSLSLMGFPFLTGFYSKDVILEIAAAQFTVTGTFAHWLGTISAFFTSFYSFRLLYLTFITSTNSYKKLILNVHEVPILMAIPLMILALGSIFVGYLTKDMMIGIGTNFWNQTFLVFPEHMVIVEAEFLPFYIKILPVFLSIVGATLALISYHFIFFNKYIYLFIFDRYIKFFDNININLSLVKPFKMYDDIVIKDKFFILSFYNGIYRFFVKKWRFDSIYNNYIVNYVFYLGYHITFRLIDRGIIEYFGPLGIVRFISNVVKSFSVIQSGYIFHYIFIMIISLEIIISYVIFADLDYSIYNIIELDVFIFFIIILFIVINYYKLNKSYIINYFKKYKN